MVQRKDLTNVEKFVPEFFNIGQIPFIVSFVLSVRENQDVLPGQKLEGALKFETKRFEL